MDEADGEPTTAPRGQALALNRRQRQELVRKNRRLADEAREAQQRPGSNLPPVTKADIEVADRIRARITATLERAQIIHPDPRPMVRKIVAARRKHVLGGANVLEVAVEQILALVSDAERVEVGDATVQEFDVLAPIYVACNAIRDAVAGKPAAFMDLLPKRDDPSVGWLHATTGASIRACAAVGLAVMTLGKAPRGGISQTKAKQEVRDTFQKEGIDFQADTVLEWAKRIRRGGDPDARAEFDELMGPVCKAAEPHWALKERRAALKRLAEIAGRKLET